MEDSIFSDYIEKKDNVVILPPNINMDLETYCNITSIFNPFNNRTNGYILKDGKHYYFERKQGRIEVKELE